MYIVPASIALAIIIASMFLLGTDYSKFFYLSFGIGVLVGVSPFLITLLHDLRVQKEKEEMFLEFARNLVESVKTGTPISKSITNAKNKNYGVLTPHVEKLGNQITLGIPLNTALHIFAKDTRNKTIARSLTLIGQAERAGGEIGEILEAVVGAITVADKLRKEQKAIVSNLVTQGYIIFIVFIIVVLIMQHKILPMIEGIANLGMDSSSASAFGGNSVGFGSGGGNLDSNAIGSSFLYLLLVQGFFSGLAIGKLAEGSMKAGLRHSFSLMLAAFFIATIANIIFG